MSEESKKIDKIEQEKASELTEKDLEQVAGGAATADATVNTHKTTDKFLTT
jgi:bacteriocin-like protein